MSAMREINTNATATHRTTSCTDLGEEGVDDMNSMSSHKGTANKVMLFATFALTGIGLVLAVGLGIFSATPQSGSVSDQLLEAAVNESGEETLEAQLEESEPAEVGRELLHSDPAVMEELKLQEVRDAYLHFDQAFPGLSIHYGLQNQCGADVACPSPQNPNEILVDKEWALQAGGHDISVVLANVHTTIAFDRLWKNTTEAQVFLDDIVPSCEVMQRAELRNAAGVLPANVNSANASVLAMRDVVLAQMLQGNAATAVYPTELHSAVQIEAAQDIATAHLPDVIIPVSEPICG